MDMLNNDSDDKSKLSNGAHICQLEYNLTASPAIILHFPSMETSSHPGYAAQGETHSAAQTTYSKTADELRPSTDPTQFPVIAQLDIVSQ